MAELEGGEERQNKRETRRGRLRERQTKGEAELEGAEERQS